MGTTQVPAEPLRQRRWIAYGLTPYHVKRYDRKLGYSRGVFGTIGGNERGTPVAIKAISRSVLFAGTRRLGINALLRRAAKGRLLVLGYHGVVSEDRPGDPLRTVNAVSLREFRWQLQTLCRLFTPISAADLLELVEGSGSLPDYPVLITFDDGFRNNLTCAAPELQRQGIPAVIHVTTGMIGSDRLLWPQELIERILAWPHRTIPMPDGGPDLQTPSAGAPRIEVAKRIRELCKRIPDDTRESYLDRLRNGPLPRGEAWHRELYDFLSWDEVRSLSRQGFGIGSHTVSHRVLTRLAPDQLQHELCQSKAEIERELGQDCPWIAYPNGGPKDFSPETHSAVERAGYRVGFTLMGGINPRRPSPLQVERVWIPGQAAEDTFHARISGLYGLRRVLAR